MQLVARGLTVRFGAIEVLHSIDLAVATGESVAIVGPSGSGKSTLLAALGGLRPRFQGTVDVEAAGVHRRASPRDLVAWVHQVPAAVAARTAHDNVALGSIAAGCDRGEADRRAHLLLERLGLAHRGHVSARRLSGGELQRVAIGRALAADRPFLLADEPTGQLDASTSGEVVRLLLELAVRELERGLVVVTHDHEVADRCDRSLVLIDGRLQP